MPDAATIEAARPVCPSCGFKLRRSPPQWCVDPQAGAWYCDGPASHGIIYKHGKRGRRVWTDAELVKARRLQSSPA